MQEQPSGIGTAKKRERAKTSNLQSAMSTTQFNAKPKSLHPELCALSGEPIEPRINLAHPL
jgi:hypothetical protein